MAEILPPRLNQLIEEAHQELSDKTKQQIDAETALKWAARSIAAFELSVNGPEEPMERLRFYIDGNEYFQEALEHAATSMDVSEVEMIKKTIAPFKWQAGYFLLGGTEGEL